MSYQVYVYVYDKTISLSELLVYCVCVLRNHQTANEMINITSMTD